MSRTYRRKSIRGTKGAMKALPNNFVYGNLSEEAFNDIIASDNVRFFSTWVKNSFGSYDRYIDKCWHGWFGDSISNTASFNYLAKRRTSKTARQVSMKYITDQMDGNVFWDIDEDNHSFASCDRLTIERRFARYLW